VYKTDAMSSDKVDVIEIVNADQVVNDYRVALTKSAKNKEGGQAFIDFILSDKGQQVLDAYGFTAPTTKQAVHTDIHV
ncbi:extracellular solute-binding protein, partial [Streptococcus anginosus]|nr:extracellular solute-binding protein [Streptococcus anginosus]